MRSGILSRLAGMSYDELRTRAAQEVSKRLDLARYRLGLQSVGLASAECTSQTGAFFFSPQDLPVLVQLLRQYLPEEVAHILAEADEICAHRFSLLGYGGLDFGPDIDWHLDPVHGKQAPLKPWFKVSYLDFDLVGDHKIIWELNRHQHLVTLAKAWVLSQEDRYVIELISQWHAWQRANPYPLGINWASSLEVAFRTLSWLWILHLLEGCPAVSSSFQSELMRALALNGHHIERYLSTYFSPNTHLLGEATALFFLGTLCRRFTDAARWQSEGWRILLDQAQRQVRADGLHFERSFYYHVYALDFFLHARLLAKQNRITVPADFERILIGMLEAVRALAQVGSPDGFGDDDGGRVFNPRRNRAEHLTDPLAIGALVFDRGELMSAATLTEEAVWLCGEAAIAALSQSRQARKPTSIAFEASGIYVIAGSNPCPQQMVIHAGPYGKGHSGHGHADALSVSFSLGDCPWLRDSGTGCYVQQKDRDRFRGTAAHNTLLMDGKSQAIPEGPFSWRSLPAVQVERWIVGSTFELLAGSHSGYRRGPDPVIHRRLVFRLHDDFWLVRDLAEGSGTHQVEIFWHFSSELQVDQVGSAFMAKLPQSSPNQARLLLLPAEQPQWTPALLPAEISPAYGVTLPACRLRLSTRAQLPTECATLLAPEFQASAQPRRFVKIISSAQTENSHGYRYEHGGSVHVVFFADRPGAWHAGPWTSDARFLYYKTEDRRITRLIFCDGSSVRFHEAPVFQCETPVGRVEWINENGLQQIFSSSENAARAVSQALFQLSRLEL